ncbi:nitroreductase / dihydropteridine reductase [Apibacter mensalis]|uniref:Nitroreductase / dihydropteridine reductase n=1 Tax=Apibacter mensalis TaxID=1586267 RepID=A0A0X3AR59_9FLAO|nr:nitroreductase family protein [Apibacter mensalis]CVK16733.1 nitroreductase / dihydropteridine reductase [Apibacter mensalis]
MDFLQLAKTRYTTKLYDPTKKVSEENIQKLKEILRLSPSSINSQPWNFIFISDPTLKDQLAGASEFNSQKIKDCSHIIVFSACDNIKKFEEGMPNYLPEGSMEYYNQVIKPQSEFEIKSWFQKQVYLSLGFFLSACADLGIDSTPMEGIEAKKYNEILNLKDYTTLFAVTIGYRNPEDQNQPTVNPKSRLAVDKIIQSK